MYSYFPCATEDFEDLQIILANHSGSCSHILINPILIQLYNGAFLIIFLCELFPFTMIMLSLKKQIKKHKFGTVSLLNLRLVIFTILKHYGLESVYIGTNYTSNLYLCFLTILYGSLSCLFIDIFL